MSHLPESSCSLPHFSLPPEDPPSCQVGLARPGSAMEALALHLPQDAFRSQQGCHVHGYHGHLCPLASVENSPSGLLFSDSHAGKVEWSSLRLWSESSGGLVTKVFLRLESRWVCSLKWQVGLQTRFMITTQTTTHDYYPNHYGSASGWNLEPIPGVLWKSLLIDLGGGHTFSYLEDQCVVFSGMEFCVVAVGKEEVYGQKLVGF